MSENVITEGAIVVFAMILLYIMLENCIEHFHLPFGHQASFIILIGMTISYISFAFNNDDFNELLKFSGATFFYLCLPPIVFASGFNMHAGNFFANIKTIMMFGIITTFVCFFIFCALTMTANKYQFMTQYTQGEWSNLDLSDAECLMMCALLCSSDVVAAISLISYDKQPRLFSIVFGEGIINDAVSIILFNTVLKYTAVTSVITAVTPFKIMLNFLNLGLASIGIGVLFGLISSYILKSFRVFSQNPVSEAMIIFSFAYLSYVLGELVEASGIITLLTCGVVMAKYSWYNLSPQGKQSSFIVFQFLGTATEAFVFSYLGLTFFSYSDFSWSPSLFLVELAIIIVGRFIGTVGLVSMLQCCGFKSGISLKELIFIWYAGMIRGAIAFGLVV